MLEGTIEKNHQIRYFHDLILNYFIKNNLKRNITILGLSFKPNTDIESVILLHKMLTDSGFEIKVLINDSNLNESIEYTNNLAEALKTVFIVIAVEDEKYKKIDHELLKKMVSRSF